MFLIRDVFQAKPGKAKALAGKFKDSIPHMKKEGIGGMQVMTDYVGNYWTVVIQIEVENLDTYLSQMRTATSKPEMQKIMEGYMELVEGGHREIYKIE